METGEIISLICLILLVGVILYCLFLKEKEVYKLQDKIREMKIDHEHDLRVLTEYPGVFEVDVSRYGCGFRVVKVITTAKRKKIIEIKNFIDSDLEFCKREAEELCEILNQR